MTPGKGFTVTWEGVREFVEQLRALPQQYTDDAREIIDRIAHDTSAEIAAAYPAPTSKSVEGESLREGMRVDQIQAGQFGVGFRVRNRAHHAWLYENGSAGKRRTARGYNRGPMRAAHVFIPIAIRRRAGMYDELVALLESDEGVTVTRSGGYGGGGLV